MSNIDDVYFGAGTPKKRSVSRKATTENMFDNSYQTEQKESKGISSMFTNKVKLIISASIS